MDELTSAVALSIASSPAAIGLHAALSLPSAQAAVGVVSAGRTLLVQEHLRARYGEDVGAAAEKIVKACAFARFNILSYWDRAYPGILREIAGAPPVIYVRGRVPGGERIAVVGTRAADPRSLEYARRFAGELAGLGFAIVSGMALGIDREAHLGALERDAPTIGVLANGIDRVTPVVNADIGERILESGNSALVSEHPPGVGPQAWSFSRRNRIVSGLARATLVVKAGERSGALITARHALEQNREVFACPGSPFDPGYAGCHTLIKNGANLAASTDDILRELAAFLPGMPNPVQEGNTVMAATTEPGPPVSPRDSIEAAILDMLGAGAMEADALVRGLGRGAAEVQESLMVLEIGGHVERLGTMVRKRRQIRSG